MPADFCLAGQKIHSPIHTRRDIKQALRAALWGDWPRNVPVGAAFSKGARGRNAIIAQPRCGGCQEGGRTIPAGIRRICKGQSRQRLRCVRPRTRHTGITANRGGLCRAKPAQPPSNPGGKPKRGRQSGRGRPQPIQRRGRARRHFPAKREPPRRKPRAKPPHQSAETAPHPYASQGDGPKGLCPRRRRG